jgi:sterol desaturase/sphingolipid hydroxylase (fatty acid hydroxylase superfamily)
MDTLKMSVAIEPMEMLSALFISGLAICSVVIVIVVHISFAVAIFRDAANLSAPRKPIFVGPSIWLLATLLGGIFITTLYWIMHHSCLNQSIPATPPED